MVISYGVAHDKDKAEFLVELVHILGFNNLPIVVGGDFNIIRKVFERNKPKKPSKWTNLFNGIIEHWALQEIELSGRNFTWSNNHEDPLFEKLDRVLASSEWLAHYPLTTISALHIEVSDHSGLLMSFSKVPARMTKPFKFELSWFLHQELYHIVYNAWHKTFPGKNYEDIWQNRGSFLRRQLKGWHINLMGATKRIKKDLSDHIDVIDRSSETVGLSVENRVLKYHLKERLDFISKEEEIVWFQRSIGR